jgi:hypothetical protein
MRLKTVAAEEAPTRYRFPDSVNTAQALHAAPPEVKLASAPVHEENLHEKSLDEEQGLSLKKVRQPLAHPKRVAAISAGFLLMLGGLHALTANEAPTVPKAHEKEVVRTRDRQAQAGEYFSAANSLVSHNLYRCETLAQKQQALKENATALSLGYEALTKKFDSRLMHFSGAFALGELFAMEYEVRRAEGKREAALKALLARIRLESVSLKSTSLTRFYNLENFNHAFEKYLREDSFTPAEVKQLHAALEVFTAVPPDWETLANNQEVMALEDVRAMVTGTTPRYLYGMAQEGIPVNWSSLADGNLLQQAQAKVALQSAILRYGAQGLVDAYVPYIQALRQRTLVSPSEAKKISLPSIPALPQSADIGRGLMRLAEQRKAWEESSERLKTLPLQGKG